MAADTNAVEHPSTPDSGQFTISRYGETSGSLTVHYTVGGTALNGVDYNLDYQRGYAERRRLECAHQHHAY